MVLPAARVGTAGASDPITGTGKGACCRCTGNSPDHIGCASRLPFLPEWLVLLLTLEVARRLPHLPEGSDPLAPRGLCLQSRLADDLGEQPPPATVMLPVVLGIDAALRDNAILANLPTLTLASPLVSPIGVDLISAVAMWKMTK